MDWDVSVIELILQLIIIGCIRNSGIAKIARVAGLSAFYIVYVNPSYIFDIIKRAYFFPFFIPDQNPTVFKILP